MKEGGLGGEWLFSPAAHNSVLFTFFTGYMNFDNIKIKKRGIKNSLELSSTWEFILETLYLILIVRKKGLKGNSREPVLTNTF